MERLDATQVALPNRVCLVPMACVGTCARRITGTCPSRRIEEDTILLVDDDGLFHHRSSGDFERLVCRIFIDIVIPVLHREKRRHKRMTDTILASNSANQQISKSAPKRIPKKKKMMKMMMMRWEHGPSSLLSPSIILIQSIRGELVTYPSGQPA